MPSLPQYVAFFSTVLFLLLHKCLSFQTPVVSRVHLMHNQKLGATFLTAKMQPSKIPLSMSMRPIETKAVLSALAATGGTPQAAFTGFALNSALAVGLAAMGQKVLTPAGLVHSTALGVLLWATLGWQGWATCVCYFAFGVLVTKVKMEEKEALGIAEGRGGRRGPENVWGSAATGALCALGTLLVPQLAIQLKVAYVASLATKLSDTFASEIGKAYGKRTFLITTLKPVPPGTEGAVSLEGTLAGVVGSIILAGFGAWGAHLMAPADIPACMVAAFIATNIESLLGATTQGKTSFLTNEVVNFINTLIGGVVALCFKCYMTI
mmetsp:Transcript_14424/g.21227  ORF Transcript_14424/g.21227 Transcript_14424/m.21227 type:complete len:323 (-) Transcript_14424:52-1020(-)